MVSEPNLLALRTLCSERDGVLGGIVTHYGLVGSPALGETGRDVAKGLPIRLLHGGSQGSSGTEFLGVVAFLRLKLA